MNFIFIFPAMTNGEEFECDRYFLLMPHEKHMPNAM
jgi:hypothetical protein